MVSTRLGLVVRILVLANGSLRVLTWVICILRVYAIESVYPDQQAFRSCGTILTVSEFSEPSEGHKRYAFFLAVSLIIVLTLMVVFATRNSAIPFKSGLASGTQDRPLSESWLQYVGTNQANRCNNQPMNDSLHLRASSFHVRRNL